MDSNLFCGVPARFAALYGRGFGCALAGPYAWQRWDWEMALAKGSAPWEDGCNLGRRVAYQDGREFEHKKSSAIALLFLCRPALAGAG